MTSPILAIVSPVLDFVFGPSPPPMIQSEMSIYPLFGPAAMCFFSKTHAPFTVVLNEITSSGRTFESTNYGKWFGMLLKEFEITMHSN